MMAQQTPRSLSFTRVPLLESGYRRAKSASARLSKSQLWVHIASLSLRHGTTDLARLLVVRLLGQDSLFEWPSTRGLRAPPLRGRFSGTATSFQGSGGLLGRQRRCGRCIRAGVTSPPGRARSGGRFLISEREHEPQSVGRVRRTPLVHLTNGGF